MDRIITLSVGTREAEEWFRIFQEISELANNLGAAHDYVSVSSNATDSNDEDVNGHEELTYDENTLNKVYVAINSAVPHLDQTQRMDIVNEIHNAGIYFREQVR